MSVCLKVIKATGHYAVHHALHVVWAGSFPMNLRLRMGSLCYVQAMVSGWVLCPDALSI